MPTECLAFTHQRVTPCGSKFGKMDIGGGREVTLIGSLEMPKDDIWLVTAILSGLIEYCAKI
ncbi:hypothetical protein ZEAMMB73_Zm00001d032874 [Zea mays]|uniref:Uncharacterized protein n=1 Tax=Zea mays TaxID=4577 RepID=A0A1D6KUL7_MAIZE|nr:hypothetical protein ZEAMMB73_Zm00001d032874 [Zea mays]ONM06258.1 hypothetical protein ZEAMMB73_Zm00001d032874 [Zea mays]